MHALPIEGPIAYRTAQRAPVRMLVTGLLAIFMLALATTPAVETISEATPETITSAVSFVVPDFVENALVAQDAEAWGWLKETAAVVSGAIAGAAVGATCSVGVVGATGGIGVLAVGGCTSFGTGAGYAVYSLWY